MKKILIDIDEVICYTSFIDRINEFKNTNYKLEDFKNYYIDDILEEDEREKFYDFYLAHDVYANVQMVDKSVESIKKLSEKYEIYLYSACVMFNRERQSGKLFADKYNFIMRELPFIKPANIIFTNTKNMFVGDIQIDDKLKNLIGPTKTKLLFTAYHNKELTDEELEKNNVIRVNNWDEVLEFLNQEI